MITDNRVLFHRVANTLNYLDIKTVVVSCGTCYDQLQGYDFEKIFPGCRIIDIHEYLLEKGVRLEGVTGVRYLYHDPCHSPMKKYEPLKVVHWQKAITLWCQGKVEIVSEYDREIRAVTFSMKLPSVIRLLRRIRVHRRLDYVPFSRANIYARDGH